MLLGGKMEFQKRYVIAAVLVLLSITTYGYAAWVFLGRLGTVTGTFTPGGILKNFNITLGEVRAGEIRIVKANSTIYVPEDVEAVIYPVMNSTVNFTYSINVFLDDYSNYIGTIDNDHSNITLTLVEGEHTLLFTIRIEAPVNITEPTPFELTLYITTG